MLLTQSVCDGVRKVRSELSMTSSASSCPSSLPSLSLLVCLLHHSSPRLLLSFSLFFSSDFIHGEISLEPGSLPTGLIELNRPLSFLVGIHVGSSSQPSVQLAAI